MGEAPIYREARGQTHCVPALGAESCRPCYGCEGKSQCDLPVAESQAPDAELACTQVRHTAGEFLENIEKPHRHTGKMGAIYFRKKARTGKLSVASVPTKKTCASFSLISVCLQD